MPFGGENAESYYDEGLTASMRGDIEHATECFKKSVQLDSSMAAAYQQLGRCYARLGQNKLAIELLQQVVNKRTDQAGPLLDLGYALLGANELSRAREAFKHALSISPNNAKCLVGLAHVKFDDGDWAGATADALQAVALGGAHFTQLYILGRSARLSGDVNRSEEAFDTADRLIEKYVEVNPDNPEGYFLRGEIAFFQEQFPAALNHYREAERHTHPDKHYLAYGEQFVLVDVLAKQGLSLQRIGENASARELGKRIIAIAPDHKIGRALSEA